jgi:heme/copper-type cytochrome/quinol oxidase subunit 1
MKSFLRIESWLLIVPIILLLIQKICFPDTSVDFHLHDTYFVIGTFYFGITILLFCCILYLCHFSLRARKSGSKKILTVHVIVTVLLLIFFFVCHFFVPLWKASPMKPRRYYDYSSWEGFQQYDVTSRWFAVMFVVFVIIQVLFILYTIVRLVVKNKS